MITLDTNPEFGLELALVLPYAYWLHEQGRLEKVITSKGMKPFYYFCDNVEEKYEHRTIVNEQSGLSSVPNPWIYGSHKNAELYKDEWEHWESFRNVDRGCGILDYREWKMPDYKNHYKNDKFIFDKPFVVISNRYNWEHSEPPLGYFNIKCLYEMFNYLTSRGYGVIYKRPKNTEFPLDQNEMNTFNTQDTLKADVEGIGVITDYELTDYYDDVILFDKILEENSEYTYNELQLSLFCNAEGFIGMSGGSTLLLNLFQKPTVTYLYCSADLRDKFWENENGIKNIKNYYYMTNPNVVPFMDEKCRDMKKNKHNEFLKTIKNTFPGNKIKTNKKMTTSVVGMTKKEVSKAEEYINGKDKVLEWGSGGSTLYFPPMVKKYVSIEHDVNWYEKLKFDINDNVEYHHAPIDIESANIGRWKSDELLDPHSAAVHSMANDTTTNNGITFWITRERYDWHFGIDYIKKPLELPHREYDVILVDGRCRAMCSYMASHLLKEDGYLIVHDFINRKYYHGILTYYEIVDQQDTLAVLKLRKEKLLGEDEVRKLSEKIHDEFHKKKYNY